jgi:predicted ATPase/class 3 adenylate cyclase
MHPLPQTGVLTFLFTDIEGSTTRWDRAPEAMADALAAHDAIVTKAIELNGGTVFKRVGDAFCSVFTAPLGGVFAAIEAQRQLARQPWDRAVGDLRIRIALHTGSALAAQDDYYGPTLNRVARLMSAGHGGQVLLSSATAALVRDELPAGVECLNLGTHRLRDLAQPETVFQLCAPELQKDFPPLRTLDVRPNNLPIELTSFVGREAELRELRELLTNKRLVTVCGPGGIGKTRLALQAAAELLEEFADGVWLVRLAHTSDPALIAQTIAASLNVNEAAGEPVEETLLRDLGARRTLVVLDNAEQLVPAIGSVVKRILDRAAQTRILVTSRESLHVRGEQIYRLGPVTEAESAQLFVARAQAVARDFDPGRDPDDLMAISRDLEGIPLAIELSAARLATLSLPEIRARLGSQLTFLRSSNVGESRHNTLRETIAWSYDLLTSRERALLGCLSVFVGGCTLAQCEEIARAADLHDVLDGVEALIDKSFLTVTHGESRTRYRMLDVIREYARERAGPDLLERARVRHCDMFLALAANGRSVLPHEELRSWLTEIDDDLANVRVALDCGFSGGSGLGGALLGMFRYWYIRRMIKEGRSWLQRFIDRRGAGDPELASVLRRASTLAGMAGAYEEADALAKRALTLYHTHDDPAGVLESLHALAVNENRRGNYAGAEKLYCDIAARCTGPGQERASVTSNANCAAIKLQRGELDAADALLSSCAKAAETLADADVSATITALQGTLALKRGDLDRASALFEEALAVKRELKNGFGIAEVLSALAIVSLKRGCEADAFDQAAESLEVGIDLDAPDVVVTALESMALLLVRESSCDDAKAAFELAQAMRAIHSLSEKTSLSRDEARAELRTIYGGEIASSPEPAANWKASARDLLHRLRERNALVSTGRRR